MPDGDPPIHAMRVQGTQMEIPSWNALVHFPAGGRKVIAVLSQPKIGEEVSSDLMSKGWIPEKVKLHQGAHRGEQFQCEIWVTRAPA